ncbi:MAG: Alpha-galactosidase-like protein [Acidobacteriaceae bacterium]|nr:Alpha-galactosidase-like protein [Acidobacteriaceae bacterium]
MASLSRRTFLSTGAAALAATTARPVTAVPTHPTGTFLNLLRTPDRATAYTEPFTRNRPTAIPLARTGERFQAPGINVLTHSSADALGIQIEAPTAPLLRVHLRWQVRTSLSSLYLGDAWERSYGELAWRSFVPERVLPWYFAAHEHNLTHAYGVRTATSALCFWQIDPEGVSLWLDLSNGGSGVLLGPRTLNAATILTRAGQPGETPTAAITAFCRKLCSAPRLPAQPVYGTNDWYYTYGHNSADNILRDTDLVASLAPSAGALPFSVIDDGWRNNPAFPDMAALASQIRKRNVRPGIWIRPLEATQATPANLLLPAARFGTTQEANAYDPTIPEALQLTLAKFTQVVDWKYDLIKHDFSTYELLGQWGSGMGATPTRPGWHLYDRTRTNAEVILNLYKAIRATAGDTLLLGCNTIGHLSAGLFELQRTGDDTSGRDWERTRRMGVNTLAFRLPQHRTFFDLDADCVGITRDIPWNLNAQWLDLLARSGTGLFLSPAPDAIGPEQKAAIQTAFAIAAARPSSVDPNDSLTQTTPEAWSFGSVRKKYNWNAPDGASPFPI